MPIIAIDPDGRIIKIVSTDPAFRLSAFTALQKLTSTQLVLLRDGTVQAANSIKGSAVINVEQTGTVSRADYVTKANKPVGTNLIKDIIDDKNTVSIKKQNAGSGNETAPDSYDAVIKGEKVVDGVGTTHTGTGIGADATIFYDPSETGSRIVNADGTKGRPAEIGLGHELGHSKNIIKGVLSFVKNLTATDPDTKQKGRLSNEEIGNRNSVDNPIRQEQRSKKRADAE